MRVLPLLVLVALVLAGCTDGGDPSAGTDPGDGALPGAADGPLVLRFVAENRSVMEDNITVTFGPQDSCVPAACAMYTATGGERPDFAKFVDITHLLPVGMHAVVEADATWDDPATLGLFGQNNLGWWSTDVWHSAYETESFSSGRATLRTVSTNHGPGPAELLLIIIEPELATSVDVHVHVRVTPLDDAVHSSHVVGAQLAGGAAPITIGLGPGDSQARLYVRGPDDEAVLTQTVGSGDTVTLPPESPAGEYLLVLLGNGAPARFMVPTDNLTTAIMRTIDTTPEFGTPRPVPAGDTVTWDVDLASAPYGIGVAFDALDGRSTMLQDGQVRVTAPDGTEVVTGTWSCQVCLFALSTFGGELAHDAYTAGTYTFTVSTTAAQGWTMYEVVMPYQE